MRKIIIGLVFLGLFGPGFVFFKSRSNGFLSPLSGRVKNVLPLEKYSFLALREREYEGSEITLERVISQEDDYISWLFSYLSDGKRVTGMLNLPKGEGPFPVVVMLRGYADDQIYFTGLGTRRAAGVFAQNGFLTLAPDFLGFGGSDSSSADILEARFERPITVLNLLESLRTFKKADKNKIFLWGHSNGGQIALSVLEIKTLQVPTTLWAPVTESFPQSVLYYMKELDDQGKIVKEAIDDFRKNYDEKNYSIKTFFSDIKAPIQVHYGTADSLIPKEWIDNFVEEMRNNKVRISFWQYQGNDHNLAQDWDMVVKRDLEFFRSFFDNQTKP